MDFCCFGAFAFVWLVAGDGVAFEVVAGGEGDADCQGDEAGQEPGTEVEGDIVERRGQDEADGIEADGQRQTNHCDDEARAQDAPTAAMPGQFERIHAIGNHCHALTVLEIAQQHHEAKEEGDGDEPAQ